MSRENTFSKNEQEKESFLSFLEKKNFLYFSQFLSGKKKNFLSFLKLKKSFFLFFLFLRKKINFLFLSFSKRKFFFFPERKFFVLPTPGSKAYYIERGSTTHAVEHKDTLAYRACDGACPDITEVIPEAVYLFEDIKIK